MSLRRFPIAALAAAALATCGAAVAAAGPWALAPGEYYTELRGSFFSTGTYYDEQGDRMPVGGLYEQRAVRSYTELGWKKRWSVQMSVPLVSNTVRELGGLVGTSSGLGDLDLGLRLSLANGPRAAAVQLRWSGPTGYNRELGPGLGNGMQRLFAGLESGAPLGGIGFVQAGAGYEWEYLAIGAREQNLVALGFPMTPKSDWADHAIVNAALGFWMGRLQVAGLYDGSFATETGRTYETTTHLAGTRFTYRVDERLDAFAGSWHSPGGENVLHLDQYYAGVAWKTTKLNRLQGFLGGDKRP